MKSLEAVAPHGKIAKHHLEMEKYLSVMKPKAADTGVGKQTKLTYSSVQGSVEMNSRPNFDLEEAEASSRHVTNKLIKIHDNEIGDIEFAGRDLMPEQDIIAEVEERGTEEKLKYSRVRVSQSRQQTVRPARKPQKSSSTVAFNVDRAYADGPVSLHTRDKSKEGSTSNHLSKRTPPQPMQRSQSPLTGKSSVVLKSQI